MRRQLNMPCPFLNVAPRRFNGRKNLSMCLSLRDMLHSTMVRDALSANHVRLFWQWIFMRCDEMYCHSSGRWWRADDRRNVFKYEQQSAAATDQHPSTDENKLRVSFTVYHNVELFRGSSVSSSVMSHDFDTFDGDYSSHKRVTVNSMVISASINGVRINNLTEPVAVVFRLKEVSWAELRVLNSLMIVKIFNNRVFNTRREELCYSRKP